MKSDGINCFKTTKASNKASIFKAANDKAQPKYRQTETGLETCEIELTGFTLPQIDQVKLRIFSTIHDLAPEEVLATALREYLKNNGPDNMKNVFKNLDDNFSQISEAN